MSTTARIDARDPSSASVSTGPAPVPDGAGAWRGQAVRETPSEESLVMDALEEIGDDFSDDMEAEFQKREVEEGHLADIIDRILGVESVANMLDNLTDLRQADLRRLLAMVLRQRFASPEQLRAFVRERFKDPTHQHAALKTLVEVLRRGGADPRRVAAAEQALRGLEQEAGPQIRAGSNIAGVADAFAGGDAARIGELRGTYRDAVLGYAGMTETFRGLLDKYGSDGLAQALRFLSAALGADLAAAGPSLDKARLQAIVEDIYRLEVLGGLAGECDAVMRHFDTPGRPCRGADLLEQVVGLMQDKWPTADKIGRLPPALCANTTDREILFLRELHELLRLIPVKAYTDDEQRPRLLDAAQGALDTAIEKEDEDDEA